MEHEKDEPRGFRVSDRRRFSDAAASSPGETAGHDAQASASGAEAAAPSQDAESTASTGPTAPPPAAEVSFSTFVLSLSTQALLHLGEIPDPQSGVVHRDLAAARQVIDILGILKQKTINNLEGAEERLLESVLYDLRLRFVQLVRAGTAKEGS